MFWFNKKKEEPVKPIEKVCKHKYKDFDWYIETTFYNNGEYEVAIKEPYVCVLCGHRIDKELTKRHTNSNTEKKLIIEEYKKRYEKHLRNAAEIEDEIADMQLVDRQFIEAYEQTNQDVSRQIKNIMSDNNKKELLDLLEPKLEPRLHSAMRV